MGKLFTENIDSTKNKRLADFVAAIVLIFLISIIYFSYLNSSKILESLKHSKALAIAQAHNSDQFLATVLHQKKDSTNDISYIGNSVIKIRFYSYSNDFNKSTLDSWEKGAIKTLNANPDTFFTRYFSANSKKYFEYISETFRREGLSAGANKNKHNLPEGIIYRITFPENLLLTPTFVKLKNNINKNHIIMALIAFFLWLFAFILIRKKTKAYSVLFNKFLTESESNFEIIQLSPNPIFIGNNSGKFIQFNRAATTLTGYSAEELSKMSMDDLFPKAELKENPLDYGSVLSGKTIVNERILRKKDGKFATVKMYSKKLPSDRLISTMVDITEEKANIEKIIGINNMLSESLSLTNSAVAYINLTTKSIILSFRLRELFNLPPEKTINCFILREYGNKKDFEYVSRKRNELKNDGDYFHFEHEIKLPDGRNIWIYHSEKLIIDKTTNQKNVVVHLNDISESKRQRLLLEEREKLFGAIFNTAQIGLAVFDSKKAIREMSVMFDHKLTEDKIENLTNDQIRRFLELAPIVKFNNKLLETLGVDKGEGLTLNLIIKEEDYQVIRNVFKAILHREKTLEVEIGAVNLKTKEYHYGLCRMSLPIIPENYHLYVSWTDITHLKKIESELRENLLISQRFMDTAPLAVIMLDRERKPKLINKFAENLLGVNFDDIKDQSFFNLINDEKKIKNAELYFQKLIDEKTLKLPHKILHIKAGDKDKYLRLYFTLIKGDDGKIENVLTIGIDVTDENRTKEELKLTTEEIIKLKHDIEKKNKELKKQNRLLREKEISLNHEIDNKNKFFSIIAHDIRSPFTALLGLSGLLESNVEQLTRNDIVEISHGINNQAKHIFSLLENLLQWARTQMKQISYNPTMVDLKNSILQAAVVFKPSAAEKEIDFIIDENISGEVYADDKILDTILRNLLSNAVKFTPPGGVIEIRVQEKINYFEISVKDTGVGIPRENINKLFDFSQHYSTLGTNKEKGSGLGLVLVKDFVEKMNGHLTIISKVGKGTTISFLVPKYPMVNKDAKHVT